MTRKDYVLQVVEQLKESPRTVLSGHKLNSLIIKTIGQRPDVMGKLATFAYSTRAFKKGSKALRKANNFKISGYRTFAEFNSKAREDVEVFMSELQGPDAETFSNENNILTFIVLPDTATGDVSDIVNLKSVAIPFNSSVKKEYKLPGGLYITIMWGNSFILPREEKKAAVKEKMNKRIVLRTKTPSKIKAELTAKAKSKLARIKVTEGKLKANAQKTRAEIQQFNEIGKTFGLDDDSSKDPRSLLNAMTAYTRDTKKFISELSPKDKRAYKTAAQAKSDKNIKLMHAALGSVSAEFAEKVNEIVTKGNLSNASKVLDARKVQFRLKLADLSKKNDELLVKAENAPTAKLRANINFAIRKNLKVIEQIKAKMKIHSSLNLSTIKNKSKLLAETNRAIEENRQNGMSIQAALNDAISKLPIDNQSKQLVKQQIIQEITNGTPLQYAVQQAIQQQTLQQEMVAELPMDEFIDFEEEVVDVFGNEYQDTADLASELANSTTISDIMKFL